MAMADGVLATKEESMLDRLGSAYLQQSELESWYRAFEKPMDLEKVACNVAIADRPLAAKLAYMVVSASREDFGFPVNAAERQAFDLLAQSLGLTELQKDQTIQEATRELARRTGFWDVLMNTFSNQFMLDTDSNPTAPPN
ncbi:hypothetical protein OAZ24_04750 [Synechococcus sp. AH-736-G21]|nr:hypothetical protein [Synechococcus sp. AH-736-G21]